MQSLARPRERNPGSSPIYFARPPPSVSSPSMRTTRYLPENLAFAGSTQVTLMPCLLARYWARMSSRPRASWSDSSYGKSISIAGLIVYHVSAAILRRRSSVCAVQITPLLVGELVLARLEAHMIGRLGQIGRGPV